MIAAAEAHSLAARIATQVTSYQSPAGCAFSSGLIGVEYPSYAAPRSFPSHPFQVEKSLNSSLLSRRTGGLTGKIPGGFGKRNCWCTFRLKYQLSSLEA
jgi:hypothetical protein